MKPHEEGRTKIGAVLLVALAAIFALALGSTMAFGSSSTRSAQLPCEQGGEGCIHIGYTEAWLNGTTVNLEYSHAYFCDTPPSSALRNECEVGAASQTPPPSGAVVSPIYVLVPLGFTPATSTLQCPVAGRCIDHPHQIDLSRVFGSTAAMATLPAHSHVLVDSESFQSTWWPVVVVGVNSQSAWNAITAAKTHDAVAACQTANGCTADIATNLYLFFQVLGPGASPGGPA